MTECDAYFPLAELADAGRLPIGDLLDDVLRHIWITGPSFDTGTNEGVIGVLVTEAISFRIPGVPGLELALAATSGGISAEVRVRFQPTPHIGIELPLTLRVDASILTPLRANTDEADLEKETLDIELGNVRVGFDIDGNFTLAGPTEITLRRCMIGSTGVILSANSVSWLSPGSSNLPPGAPDGFSGLHMDGATIEISTLPIPVGMVAIRDVFIGTGGFSGTVSWSDPSLTWESNGSFSGVAAGELFGFQGAINTVQLAFRQSALTACEIEGNVFVPYLDRVIGLSLGFDGNGGLTSIAQAPTCAFSEPADAATAGPSGYLLTTKTDAFTLDISRVEFHAGGAAPASLVLSGRAKLEVQSLDLPAVVFKGLRIDTQGQVAVEGGWLDVETSKSAALSGFPFQITKIGFGAEIDGRRWVGLNGGIKLADGLPMGASVEGLRVSWDPVTGSVGFTLEGIGVALSVPGSFSLAGRVAFFSEAQSSGFRGSIKLTLDTLKLTVDARMMVGRAADGTSYFFLFLDIELPAGIPLFSTGAAIYGFAGLVATNLRPSRLDGEDWYHGYYRRPPVGVTEPDKWTIEPGGFAIGLGATVGSLPDTGFAFSAKALLVLVLPGPQLLLQGKGQFISKRPDQKDPSSEGNFEALMVLDVPGKLFQANLSAAFSIPVLLEVAGGVSVAFSWAPAPPSDLWHVYLGEKSPPERRIHATLLKLLGGDTWLMINRPGTSSALPDRKGDLEIGGYVGISMKFNFSVASAWLDASIFGEAAVSWDPKQFAGSLSLKGGAGISVLGLSVTMSLLATVEAKAPTPWYLAVDIELGIKVDLLLVKWEFHAKLPLEFGSQKDPLPQPVSSIASISADHAKADEARVLQGAVVPPDVRPLIVFARPVLDAARFGSPGRDDLPEDDLGLRKISYRVRHVVLLGLGNAGPRLVGAAGEAVLSGSTVSFPGLGGVDDSLPNLAGASISLFQPGETPRTYSVSAGTGASATITGTAPAGSYAYRLSAPQPSAAVEVTTVADAPRGDVTVSLAAALPDPSRFRGGTLTIAQASWLVLEATSTTLRLRISSVLPAAGPATLVGPPASSIEGQWAPTGEPATDPGSSTRLQVWARTPFAFFRHNEQNSVMGLDPFKPGYACGPEPREEPICTQFEDVAVGPLQGSVSTAGVAGSISGIVNAVAAGIGSGTRLELGDFVSGRGSGTVTFTFEPLVDAVWVTAATREGGMIRARQGERPTQVSLSASPRKHLFTGGVQEIEVTGSLATVYQLCFVPGWTCVHFEAASFPPARTGQLSYAGVTLESDGAMNVNVDVLEVDPPLPPVTMSSALTVERVVGGLTAGPFEAELPVVLPVVGLVEPVMTRLPSLGLVQLIPGLTRVPGPTPVPGPGGPIAGLGGLPLTAVDSWRDSIMPPGGRRPFMETGRVWVEGNQARLASVAIRFPSPVTRVRVKLAGTADVIAFAGKQKVMVGNAAAGSVVALYADPAAPSHLGWIDRVVIFGPSQVRVGEVCTDAGKLGWARYEQWKWSQGVQRSVESLYRTDPILPAGDYELRVHTVAVVTGEQPFDVAETARASFTVGDPPGFPVQVPATVSEATAALYPFGGPLVQLETYVERTMPRSGTGPWYRAYDTAVRFNEPYITRMYLESGRELRVSVVNANGVELRPATRHVWSGTDASLDAWTILFIRTLNGDGSDRCASVDLGKVTRPEQVTAGRGEPLEPECLHASELQTTGAGARTLHRFEFVTSRFATFRHHIASFDGRCRRRESDPGGVIAAVPPRKQAEIFAGFLGDLGAAIRDARDKQKKAVVGVVTTTDLDDATAAMAALADLRADLRQQAAAVFEEVWLACFGPKPPAQLPDGLRVQVVQPAAQLPAANNVLLVQSPEPIAWERVKIGAAYTSSWPLRKLTATVDPEFGRPDAGFEVEFGGIRWLAGVELWQIDGAVRARANVPLDVSLLVDNAMAVELVLRVDDGGQATVSAEPPLAAGPITKGPSVAPVVITLTAPAGTTIARVRVVGPGVGITAITVTVPFVPSTPMGYLRITDIRLPTTTQLLDHEVTVLAIAPLALSGYVIRWIDALNPGASQLYSILPDDHLREGQRVRLVPGRVSAPAVDDALVFPGGGGSAPPTTGAVYQVVDPAGRVVHECAALPSASSTGTAPPLVAFPSVDGTRAFLVPTVSARPMDPGYWTLNLELSGEAGPDLDQWSVGGFSVVEKVALRFLLR